MTTVRDIDHLVVSDDAVAARLWPRLGPKVRDAYLHDRDAWVVLRRNVEAGASLSVPTLAHQHKVFAGWARAFRVAATGKTKRPRPPTFTRRAPGPAFAVSPAAIAPKTAAVLPSAAVPPPLIAPAAAAVTKTKGSTGAAVAGGLVLAGLIAVAARRARA